ncbi:uncharacterized protein KY384_000803 [Bacidia gigantensis]|uniref:uncharacterized protein n=1 Tax=Bacidia gigantensis TaxID=2732470 RepID=UPI001D049627|nr:uncharacterized protein KY384_000803 [Bacidia gigantensis]KAG8526041.1 hypothetical protein KY384_000803 [Bacidia gigantensis]
MAEIFAEALHRRRAAPPSVPTAASTAKLAATRNQLIDYTKFEEASRLEEKDRLQAQAKILKREVDGPCKWIKMLEELRLYKLLSLKIRKKREADQQELDGMQRDIKDLETKIEGLRQSKERFTQIGQ